MNVNTDNKYQLVSQQEGNNLKNELDNALKENKLTFCGRLFSHPLQGLCALGLVANGVELVYDFIDKRYFDGALSVVTEIALVGVYFGIPHLVSRKKVEQTLNNVTIESEQLIEKNEMNEKLKESVEKLKEKNENLNEMNEKLKESVEKLEETLKIREQTILRLENENKDLSLQFSEANNKMENLKKTYNEIDKVTSEIIHQANQFSSSNKLVQLGVKEPNGGSNLSGQENEKSGVLANELENVTKKFDEENDELVKNIELIKGKIQELQENYLEVVKDKSVYLRKGQNLDDLNKHVEKGTQDLEKLLRDIPEKQKALEQLAHQVQELKTKKEKLVQMIDPYLQQVQKAALELKNTKTELKEVTLELEKKKLELSNNNENK